MSLLNVFLDASVILSGLASPSGGSGKLFLAARLKKIELAATPLIIEEVNRNLNKLGLKRNQLEAVLRKKIVRLIPDPDQPLISRCQKLTPDINDAHVIAGAISGRAGFLLSLDKKHLVTQKLKRFLKPVGVMTPREFWQSF